MTRPSSWTEAEIARIPKACLPCARLKVRCEVEAGKDACKRCRRLNKSCRGQVPGAHRRKISQTTKIAEPGQNPNKVPAVASFPLTVLESATSWNKTSPIPWINHFVESESEAEMLLWTFRSDMEPLFPFVITSPYATVQDIRAEKPFLFLAILMVSCRHDQARQTAIAQKIREITSYAVLIEGERNLDILQSLLVYVNWYHYHIHLGSQVCNLVHLIMSLMIELSLNKEIKRENPKPGFGRAGYFGKAGSVPSVMPTASEPHTASSSMRNLEERRTFLGCFFLTSVVSLCIRDIEHVRSSRYAEECCSVLSESAQYATDPYVVYLARLYGLADKITHVFTPRDGSTTAGFVSAPVCVFVEYLESDLLHLKNSFPVKGHHNDLFLIHQHIVEIFLYGVALNEDPEHKRNSNYPFTRLNMLHACLNSTKLCIDIVYRIPLLMLFDLPYTTWSLLGYAIVNLSKLALVRADGWNAQYARNILDMSDCMDTLVLRLSEAKAMLESSLEQAGSDSSSKGVSQFFVGLPSTLERVKNAHQAMYMADWSTTDQSLSSSSAGTAANLNASNLIMPSSMPILDFLDEDFWQYFM